VEQQLKSINIIATILIIYIVPSIETDSQKGLAISNNGIVNIVDLDDSKNEDSNLTIENIVDFALLLPLLLIASPLMRKARSPEMVHSHRTI